VFANGQSSSVADRIELFTELMHPYITVFPDTYRIRSNGAIVAKG
jgi:hypothetical protein